MIKERTFSDKLLIVASFWEGDKAQMSALLRLIADMEKTHCKYADLLLVNRYDCNPMPAAAVQYLSRKFNVRLHESPGRGTGWPNGCNDLFFGAMGYFFHMKEAKRMPNYKAALILEPDCVPLDRNWIQHLSLEWDRVNGERPVCMAGVQVEAVGIHQHINGACLVTGKLRFLDWLVKRVGGGRPNVGWDYGMAADFRRWGVAALPCMSFYWKTATMTEERWLQEKSRGIVLMHGVKDDSAIAHARKFLV